jgi:putative ABC transport system permease protein
MLWRLAIHTLLRDRGKLIAGLVGVIFAVVLVNLQGGLYLGLIGKASLLVDRSHANVWIGESGMHNVDFAHPIPTRWLHRVRSVPGVAEAEAIVVAVSEMSLPSHGYEGVMVIGVNPLSRLGHAFTLREGSPTALQEPHGVIVDACDDDKLDAPRLGELREVGGQKVRITGRSHGTMGFLVTPYLFTSRQRAYALTQTPPDMCSYILVRTDRAANVSAVCDEINRRIPGAMAVSADRFADISVRYWMQRTGLGISFGAATLLGLLVGLVMVGQTLYAMVLDRLQEYATLKAIGATERELLTVLLGQSLGIAAIGVAIGLLVTGILQRALDSPRAPITISPALMLTSASLVLLMCIIAVLLPYLRIRDIDPQIAMQA